MEERAGAHILHEQSFLQPTQPRSGLLAGAAQNALALVPPPQAWLEDPAAPDQAANGEGPSTSAGAFLGSPLPRGPYLPPPPSPRSPLPEGLQEVPLHAIQLLFSPCAGDAELCKSITLHAKTLQR